MLEKEDDIINDKKKALHEMNDVVKEITSYVGHWEEIFNENGIHVFDYEFREVLQLASKLNNDVNELKLKIDHHSKP